MNDRNVILITGAGRGLGRAMALAAAKRSPRLVIHYSQHEQQAQETAALATQLGAECWVIRADIQVSSQVNAMVAEIEKKWGRIDVVINNAGTTLNRTIARMSDDEWNEVISTNLTGPFFVTRAVLPLMQKQQSGVFLNIASYLAARPAKGAANYAASKAGLIALTKTTAVEGGPFHIRANAILPGFHVTDMNRDVWQKMEKEIRAQHLLAEMPEASELAEFVLSLSDLKSVTGQVFSFESRLS